MSSTRKSNGYPLQAGQPTNQSNPLGEGIRPPISLGFMNSSHPVNLKKDYHLSRHDRWDKGHQYQREVPWQRLVAWDRNVKVVYAKSVIAILAVVTVTTVGTAFIIANEVGILRLEPVKEVVR